MRYLKSAKCIRELKQNDQPNIHVTYTKPCIYGEKKQIQLLWRFHYIIAKKFNCGYINGKNITPQLYRTMKGAILHGDIKQFYNFLDNIGVKYIRESIEETVLKSTIRKSRNTDHGGYILKSKLRGIKKLNEVKDDGRQSNV